MKQTDVLIIGGSAGGLLSAMTSRKVHPEKHVTLIRKTKTVMVPCGIPYIFGTLEDTAKNRIPDAMITDLGVELLINEVQHIDADQKTVRLLDGEQIQFDKLILATGSLPIVPSSLEGHNLENVFPIMKSEEYLAHLLETLDGMTNISVIGGGFIGVEFAEQLQKKGKHVTLIELADEILWQAFDSNLCQMAAKDMTAQGITLKTGERVQQLIGTHRIEGLLLSSGESIPADAVILGMGVIPNTSLAQEAGIQTDDKGAILVDEYMRTSKKDIFAVGDCAKKRCFFTNKDIAILLASTAAMEAKLAASNLYGLRFLRGNKGTISAFSTKIYDTTYASAGLTERRAIEEGFEFVLGRSSTMDKHPGTLPGANKIDLKLLFSKTSGVLLGAQVSGGDTVGEMINLLSLAIQNGLTAYELNTFQTATHPLITSSPIAYPINAASLDALTK